MLASNNGKSKDDASTDIEPVKRIGLTIFFLVFGVFGLWAAFAPLDGAALAPGLVTVKSYKKLSQIDPLNEDSKRLLPMLENKIFGKSL